jgi:sugar phosphate isomerase/epimerase
MRFGCCSGLASFVPPTLQGQRDSLNVAHAEQCAQIPDLLSVMAAAGFDYVEFGVGTTVPEQPAADFETFLATLESSSLRAEAFSSFIPPWLRLAGPEVDWPRVQRYVEVATERVARAGGRVIVFGSGGARSVPEGWPQEEAEAQLSRFLRFAGDCCESRGIVLCIEPLNATETNAINRVAQGAAWARRIAHPSVRLLADCFHMSMEGESFSEIMAARELLAHVHVADKDRRYPAEFGYDLDGFFAALKTAVYDGRVSIEANFTDFAREAPAGLERIRRAAAD